MKKITLLTLLCVLLTIPIMFGQTSLTSGTNNRSSTPAILVGPPGSATLANNDGPMQFAPVVITNNLGQTWNGPEIACAGSSVTDNLLWNEYDLDVNFGITADFNVTAVEVGIGTATITTPVPMTVNIYSNDGVFPGGTWTLQGTALHMLTSADSGLIISIPVAATIPAGDNLLYEIFVDGDAGSGVDFMRFMTNADGYLADSWILAVDCGIGVPTTMTGIGLPVEAWIMNVIGDELGGPVSDCSSDTPLPIDSIFPTTTSTIAVVETGVLGVDYDIDFVSLDITHTFDGDLTIVLESPTGSFLTLSDSNGGSDDDYTGTVFQDGGADITLDTGPFSGGPYAPQGPGDFATNFGGESITGGWMLHVTDNFGGDIGTLNDWCIEMIPLGAPPAQECGAPLGQGIPDGAPGTTSGPMIPSVAAVADCGLIGTNYMIDSVDLDLNHTFDGDLDITLTSPSGTVLDLSLSNGGAGDDYLGTIFMDGAPPITGGAPPFTGTFEPQGGPMNIAFAGENIEGDWTLNIVDNFGGDSGVLNNFCINYSEIAPNLPPAFLACPGDSTIPNGPGQCGAVVVLSPPVALDPEDGVLIGVQIGGPPSGTLFPVGPNLITFEVTDSCGLTDTCSFTITVDDVEPPVAVCADFTAQLNAAGTVTITPGDVMDPSSSDNCGITSMTVSPDTFSCADVGANTVTLTVFDAAGNSHSCTATVTVEDNVAPDAVCIDTSGGGTTTGTASGAGAGVGIPDADPTGTTSPASVGGIPLGATLLDISVELDITHTWAGDLTIELIAPTGETNSLVIGPGFTGGGCCGDSSDFLTGFPITFDDASANPAEDMGSTILGADVICRDDGLCDYFPTDDFGTPTPFATMIATMLGNGSDPNGTWLINIADTASGDIGTLNSWSIDIDWEATSGGPIDVFLDVNGDASITPVDIDGGSSDACGIASMTVSPNTFTCADVGINVVTLTVTDVNGNVATCTSEVNVIDNIPPVAICQDITVQLDANGDASITPADIDNGSNDACGIDTLVLDIDTFDCSDVGTPVVVTLTVTDVNGNVSTCTATVTVEDNVPPVAVCQDIDVFLDGAGNASIVPADVDGGSTDACGIASLSIDIDTFTCADIGPNNVTLTVTDVNGNSSSCVAVVTVIDDIPPVISCPLDISVDNEIGLCSAVVIFPDAIALDNCAVTVAQTGGLPSGSDFPVGDTIIEFTATDEGGNTTVCTFTITVNDVDDPTITCPADVIVDNDAGLCGADLTIDPPVMGDNCPLVFTQAVIGPVTQFLGTSQLLDTPTTLVGCDYSAGGDVTIEATYDGDWNSSAEDFELLGPDGTQIFFRDNQGGSDCVEHLDVFTVPEATWDNWIDTFGNDLTFTLVGDTSVNPTTLCTNNFYQLTAIQGVGATLVNDYNGTDDASDFYPVGTTTVTWTLTDAAGNSVQCSFDVTVNDVEAPVISCVGEPGVASVLEEFEGGTVPAGWSTVIVSGSWDWTFGSGDMPGAGDFPTNAAIFDDDAAGSNGDNNVASLLSPVYDNTGAATAVLSFDYALGDFAGSGFLNVEVWDGAAWQQIFLADNVDIDPTNTGPIDVLPYVNADFQVRFTYDDENSGWNWGAGVDNFVFDYDIPGGLPLVVELDANGMATIDAADLINSATDNCGIASISVGGGGGAPGFITTLFATGNNGSPGGAVYFDITVGSEDLELTSLDTNTDDPGALTMDVYTLVGTYVGNEADIGAWTLQTSGSGTGAGVDNPSNIVLDSSITLSAGESYGMALVFTSASSHFYTNGDGSNENYDNGDLALSLGAATNVPFEGTPFSPRVWNGTLNYFVGSAPSSTVDFTCDDLGINEIEVTVTDIYGNTSTCTATVEVLDVTSPVLVCADVTIELDEDGIVEIDPQDLLAYSPSTYQVITISSDNGSGAEGFTDFTVNVTAADTVSFDWDFDTADGPAFDSFGYLLNGVYTELTDPNGGLQQSGNSGPINVAPGDVFGFRSYSLDGLFGACTTTISNFVPGFTGQFDPANWLLDLVNSDGDAYFVEIPGGPLSFDACGITIWAVDITEVTCADIGTPIVITVFASDASGNIASCQSTVTVVDLLGPEIVCPEDQTHDPGPGNLYWEVPDYWANGEATATDNCTDPVVVTSQDPAAGTLLPDGVYTVTMCAEDEYGNESCCTFELTIESILGIDDNDINFGSIIMYPNPARDIVNLNNPQALALDQAAIYDLTGRLVQTIDLRDMGTDIAIDISHLASATYMVLINGENGHITKQLIKE